MPEGLSDPAGLLIYVPLGVATAIVAAVLAWLRFHEKNEK
jgi:hypothetical protein